MNPREFPNGVVPSADCYREQQPADRQLVIGIPNRTEWFREDATTVAGGMVLNPSILHSLRIESICDTVSFDRGPGFARQGFCCRPLPGARV